MRTNKLKLNDNKTEFVLFGTRQQMETLQENDTFKIEIGRDNQTISISKKPWLYMESQLKSQTCIKSLWHGILHSKECSKDPELVNTRSGKIIIQGLVTSKPDYCNGLRV